MLLKSTSWWAAQLSSSNRTYIPWTLYLLFSPMTQSLNDCDVIRAFLLAAYSTPSVTLSTHFKHLGLAAFPMTSGLIFSPVALAQSKTVRRSYECLPPLHKSFFTTSNLDGTSLKKRPVLSALKMSPGNIP